MCASVIISKKPLNSTNIFPWWYIYKCWKLNRTFHDKVKTNINEWFEGITLGVRKGLIGLNNIYLSLTKMSIGQKYLIVDSETPLNNCPIYNPKTGLYIEGENKNESLPINGVLSLAYRNEFFCKEYLDPVIGKSCGYLSTSLRYISGEEKAKFDLEFINELKPYI